MLCPSLLYLEDSARASFCEASVCTDLLGEILSADSIRRILCIGASPEEILARQAIFTAMDTMPPLPSALTNLADAAAQVLRLHAITTARTDEPGRVLLTAHLAAAFLHLLDAARLPPIPGALATRFTEYIETLSTSPEICQLRQMPLPSFREQSWQLKTGDMGIRMDHTPNAREAEWEADMHAIGLPPTPEKRRSPREMPPSFAAAIARLQPKEYTEAHHIYEALAPYLLEEAAIPSLAHLREDIAFYHSVMAFTKELRQSGYPMTMPTLTTDHVIHLCGVRDPILHQRGIHGRDVIPNDTDMRAGGEHFFWLTGANGGGKTVYLRAVGIAVLLAENGCPIPAEGGEIGHFSALMTHFPAKEEQRGMGRFEEEHLRATDIAARATDTSVVLLNETYTGTDETKATRYARELAETLYQRGAIGLYVTHLHELTGGDIPTLAATVSEDGHNRSYRIVRVRNTHSSHAADILYSYGLTDAQLRERRAHHG